MAPKFIQVLHLMIIRGHQ